MTRVSRELPLEVAELLAERTSLDARIAELDAQITAAKKELGPLWDRSKFLRDEIVRRTYLVDCPKCGMPASESCMNLSTKKHKAWPHRERIDSFAEQVGGNAGLGLGFS